MKLIIALIVLALTERLVFDLGPNVELVTMATILASVYSSQKLRYFVPLIIMALSDWKLGVGVISWFTWSGFLMMGLLPGLLGKLTRDRWLRGVGGGLVGAVWFFIWTNGGVWLTDSWGMYSRDGWGLYQCYVNGLPFLRNNLASTMVFVPIGLALMELVRNKRLIYGNNISFRT